MGLKEYFSGDLRATIAYSVLGVIAGYASFAINNPRVAFAVMLVILIVSTAAMKYAFKVNYRWFASNGVIAFLFIWFIVWTVFYNLNVAV